MITSVMKFLGFSKKCDFEPNAILFPFKTFSNKFANTLLPFQYNSEALSESHFV